LERLTRAELQPTGVEIINILAAPFVTKVAGPLSLRRSPEVRPPPGPPGRSTPVAFRLGSDRNKYLDMPVTSAILIPALL